MDELFNVIGKLYVEIYNSQKVLQILQDQIRQKDEEIQHLKSKILESKDE